MISKKDLLKQMDISYGQLYRWKREGLIPDEWFVKQAVKTGQETYFDEELIIPRIRQILNLKDGYQLEEMKTVFDDVKEQPSYSIRKAVLLPEIDPLILRMYLKYHPKETISLTELAFIYFFSINEQYIEVDEYIEKLSIPDDLKISGLSFYLLYDCDNEEYYFLCGKNSIIDFRLTIINKWEIEEVVSLIAKSLKE